MSCRTPDNKELDQAITICQPNANSGSDDNQSTVRKSVRNSRQVSRMGDCTSPHLCVLTTAHPLDDVRVTSKFVTSYLAAGWRVSWIGPDDNLFNGKSRGLPGVTYHLVRRRSGRLGRLFGALKIFLKAKRVKSVDWWYSPDPDAAFIAHRISKRQGGQVLFDIHEEFHGAMLDRWTFGRPTPAAREFLRKQISSVASASDIAVAVNAKILQSYITQHPRAFLVRNCAPRSFAAARPAAAQPFRRLRVMHGKAHEQNGTSVALRALALINGVEMVLFSESSSTAKNAASKPGALIEQLELTQSAILYKLVPHGKMPGILSSCQVGIIAYGRDLGISSLPNRLFEYMSAGMAVIVPSYSEEMVKIVQMEKIGLVCDMEDPRSLAESLLWMQHHPQEVAHMGTRALDAFRLRHCWETDFGQLFAETEASIQRAYDAPKS